MVTIEGASAAGVAADDVAAGAERVAPVVFAVVVVSGALPIATVAVSFESASASGALSSELSESSPSSSSSSSSSS
jgi:hypothetical protein